ncbi:MAG: VWA domain-containing protein [Candidatus Woesearchaeota archaeon]
MEFINPHYLWGLMALPVMAYAYYRAMKKRDEKALKFSHVQAVRKMSLSWRRHIMIILAGLLVLSLLIALADPHIPLKQTKKGVNVVLALDVSGSMKAEDYAPNRMEAAKLSAQKLVKELKPKDKVGIVIFHSGATTAAYLTSLQERALDKLSSISANDGRTAIGDGLGLAIDMVTSIPNKKKVVILLSDGVNNAGVIQPNEAISYAQENNIQVFTVGMGSEGKTVIGRDFFGRPQYAELDEELLQEIAHSTGGDYFKAVDERTLDNIYERISEEIEREKEDTSIKDWFIALALLIMGIMLYLESGRFMLLR